jgi:septin family protein
MMCGPAGIGKTSFIKLFMKKFNSQQAQALISTMGKISLAYYVVDNDMPHEPYQEYSFSRSTKNIDVYTIERREKNAR